MAKPKTVQTPSADDVRRFIEVVEANALTAAGSHLRGIPDDHPGFKRTYDWLKHYAETGTFPPAA